MDLQLVQLVAARVETIRAEMDPVEFSSDTIRPPLSKEQLAETVRELGFDPPPLYVYLMRTVGNGGYGPGCGLMGLAGGATDDLGNTAVELYRVFAEDQPDRPSWRWPQGLLPICHWGCAIYTCVDCASDGSTLTIWDPNEWDEVAPPASAIRATGTTLPEWLRAWAKGEDVKERMNRST